jgi:hypothetical protein
MIVTYLNNPRLSNIKNVVFIIFIYKILCFLNDTLLVHGPNRTYREVKAYLAEVSGREKGLFAIYKEILLLAGIWSLYGTDLKPRDLWIKKTARARSKGRMWY